MSTRLISLSAITVGVSLLFLFQLTFKAQAHEGHVHEEEQEVIVPEAVIPQNKPLDTAAIYKNLQVGSTVTSSSVASTKTAVTSGNWNNPATWGGAVPTAAEDVKIPQGRTVVIDTNARAATVEVAGTLRATNTDASLTTRWVMVMGANSKFEVGTAVTPFVRSFTLELVGNDPNENIHSAGTKFLMAMDGGEIHMHGKPQVSWTKLDGTVAAGATQIKIATPVTWSVGNQIVIASSVLDPNQTEVRTITNVSADLLTLTLDKALDYRHVGVAKNYTRPTDGKTWILDQRAEVGLLTHNVRVIGDAASETAGFGAHVMIMKGAKGFFSDIELHRVGQKKRMGRYPIHWHMAENLSAGQYIKNSSIHRSYNRAVTLHGSEGVIVERNVAYDHMGHGIFLEDGSERYNKINYNLVMLTRKPLPGDELLPSDNERNEVQNRTPSSFWITNPNNEFIGNVAAGTVGTGYWFIFPQWTLGLSASVSSFQFSPRTQPLGIFRDNVAHSNMSGFDVNDSIFPSTHQIQTNLGWVPAVMSYLDNFTLYANSVGLYSGTDPSVFEKITFRNVISADNYSEHVRFAHFNTIDNSLFVRDSGNGILPANVKPTFYALYDGAGRVYRSHFVGFDTPNSTFFKTVGASVKNANHLFSGLSFDPATRPYIMFPDCSSITCEPNGNVSNVGVYDVDGSLTGRAGSTVTSNNPLMLTSSSVPWSNGTFAYVSPFKFKMIYLGSTAGVTWTRSGGGEPTVTFTDNSFRLSPVHPSRQLHAIDSPAFSYSYAYTYEQPPATPTVTPQVGAVASRTEIAFDSMRASSIRYTKDPTLGLTCVNGVAYDDDNKPIVREDTTFRVVGCNSAGMSPVATFTYTVANIVPTLPTATPGTGSVQLGTLVTLDSLNATSIRYTRNGTVPTCTAGTLYGSTTKPTVTATTTLKAIGCNSSGTSPVATFSYTVVRTLPTAPTAVPESSSVTSGTQVFLNSVNASSIRYTINGSQPSCTAGTLYGTTTKPIITATTTLKSVGCNTFGASPLATYTYTITPPAQNLPPVISSVSGPSEISQGASGTWVVNASDPDGDTLRHRIHWGDGKNKPTPPTSEPASQQPSASHVYDVLGTFTGRAEVYDGRGATTTKNFTVNVVATSPRSALTRYSNGYDRLELVRPPSSSEASQGYVRELELGILSRAAGAGLVQLYSCAYNYGLGTDYMVSKSATCEGQVVKESLGYGWTTTATNRIPIYRCYLSGFGRADHFLSKQSNCENRGVVENNGRPFFYVETETALLPSAPVASPAAGTVVVGTQVALSAQGATSVRYTIDGTAPTCSTGIVYATPITISTTVTVQAVGCNTAGASTMTSFAYTVIPPDSGTSNATPVGALDIIGLDLKGTPYISGWAFDPNASSTELTITIEKDGAVLASMQTDVLASGINSRYAITGKHRFRLNLDPSQLVGTYRVLATDVNTQEEYEIKESPRTLSAGAPCFLDGVQVPSGFQRSFYTKKEAVAPELCSSLDLVRLCTDGSLSGTAANQFASCTNVTASKVQGLRGWLQQIASVLVGFEALFGGWGRQ